MWHLCERVKEFLEKLIQQEDPVKIDNLLGHIIGLSIAHLTMVKVKPEAVPKCDKCEAVHLFIHRIPSSRTPESYKLIKREAIILRKKITAQPVTR